jgi:hypothetical protein
MERDKRERFSKKEPRRIWYFTPPFPCQRGKGEEG